MQNVKKYVVEYEMNNPRPVRINLVASTRLMSQAAFLFQVNAEQAEAMCEALNLLLVRDDKELIKTSAAKKEIRHKKK